MHPADDIWQALIDGESPPDRVRALQQHRAGCPRCDRRCSEMEAAHRERQVLLATIVPPVPAADVDDLISRAKSRRRSAAWRPMATAATIVLVVTSATVAVASPRFRHVFARAWQRLASPHAGLTEGQPDSSQAVAPVGVAFEPHGPLEIAFEAHQADGELRIALAKESSKVSIVATRAVRYNVRSGTVVVSNTGTRATYDIAIPRGYPQATVLVAGDTVFVKDGRRVSTHLAGSGQDDTYVLPFRALLPTRRGAAR